MAGDDPMIHPISDSQPKRSVADVISRGASWRHVPDEYLTGQTLESHGTDAANQTPAVIEMQRRLKGAIQDFNRQSSEQTTTVIGLTESVRRLTIVITWLTIAAAVFGGIQAAAVLVHFYRWYRGWP